MQHSESSPSPVDIAIVGGGASGVLLAAQLVRKSNLRVALIERDAHPGLGVAYSTHCLGHLLNVRASDMTALADEPDHFVQWLARDGRGFGPTDFVPRAIYGQYLQDLLADTVRRSDGRLEMIGGVVVGIRHEKDGVEVDIEDHVPLRARKAVLATGHRPPSKDSGAYRGNPWREDAIAGLVPDASILLIGTSLTMIDVLISLLEHGHKGPIVALSRRGLVPHHHPPAPIPTPDADTSDLFTGSLSQRTARFRAKLRAGLGWPGLMQLLRPHNNELWHGLDLDQRRRFLRHLRPWWDIHRHRVAPHIGEQIDAARARGQLSIVSGRIEIGRTTDDEVEVTIIRRGSTERDQRRFDRVVDCRGPRNEVDVRLPLHAQLVKDGLLRPDPLNQGLDIAEDEALLSREGTPSKHLFVLGPPTRGRYTEIVAIPDIRIQAAAVADQLIAQLREPSGLAVSPAA
ncbi:FAD/NAD(P)-binding protein [Reyranella sp.]|uniref:FAD/NAD(P)-binding protein n=1 Tax=Reyranella sp. TaxID=1929291 RepID=UPI003D1112ED